MKTLCSIQSLATLALVSGAVWLAAGCATTKPGYQHAEKTGDKMADLRKDLIAIETAVEDTTRAMEDVVQQAQVDPRKPFTRFSKAVNSLEAADAKARARAEEMREEGKLFFEGWETDIATMQNAQVKALAQQRKTELNQRFRKISLVTIQMKDDFNPWMSDVRDLHKFLSNDLTPAGIKSATELIARTRVQSAKVKESLEYLVRELDLVEEAITPANAKRDGAAQSAMNQ